MQWTWECYNVTIDVTAKAIEPARRVVIEWPGYSRQTQVEWTFQSLPIATRGCREPVT
ncbi:SRPBCC family protein [Steroidobacter agaridevorans]|uniref:hypothetical protein n=1 Tax=Steroidobacter agaridevorans TaxID=2695856 RepID=UPI00137B45BF|nr:hypothetical protein [Steroidobacter agaridevorans]